MLLNLLARDGERTGLFAAAAVSAPYDLGDCARYLDSDARFAAVYRHRFPPTMKAKALEKARRFPHLFDAAAIRATRAIPTSTTW